MLKRACPEMEQAVDELMGQVRVGNVVAHRSHRLTHTLVDVVGNIGVCELPNGNENRFPVSELFDVNRVKNRAVDIRIRRIMLSDLRGETGVT